MVTSVPSRSMKQRVERQRPAVVGNFLAHGAVQPHRLEEHHRIRIADRGEQQAVGPRRRGRAHHANAGDVAQHGLGALRMVFGRMDAAAVRRADHDRTAQAAAGPMAHARHVIDDLIERRIHEAHELDFRDGLQALRRHADRHAGDGRLGERRVLHARHCRSAPAAPRSRGTRRRWRRRPVRSRRRCGSCCISQACAIVMASTMVTFANSMTAGLRRRTAARRARCSCRCLRQ